MKYEVTKIVFMKHNLLSVEVYAEADEGTLKPPAVNNVRQKIGIVYKDTDTIGHIKDTAILTAGGGEPDVDF